MGMNVYAICTIPILILVVSEFIYCLVKKNGFYTFQDSVSSMGTAIVNQCVNLLVAAMFFPAYNWLHQTLGFHGMPESWWSYILLFFVIDFLFYWFHRTGHTLNIFWAAHMPHHSTEELNYAVALRASVTQRLASFFFYWPAAFLWKAELVLPMVAFHLVLQFIPHTRVIPKLPRWIESWLNTPSHHRVHHACNKHYRNKNFAGFIIIWDKLFGSFVEEKEAPYFGVTTPPQTWDPTIINFQWWGYLWKDAVNTKSWWDKIRLWFKPIGWRPADLPPRGVYVRPECNAETQIKFHSKEFSGVRPYLLLQIPVALGVMLWITRDSSPLTGIEKWTISFFLWCMATAWGGMLESKRWSKTLEEFRILAMGVYIIFLFEKYDIHKVMTSTYLFLTLLTFIWLELLWVRKVKPEMTRGVG